MHDVMKKLTPEQMADLEERDVRVTVKKRRIRRPRSKAEMEQAQAEGDTSKAKEVELAETVTLERALEHTGAMVDKVVQGLPAAIVAAIGPRWKKAEFHVERDGDGRMKGGSIEVVETM